MTYILGISCFYHDSAASLIKDGEIISAVQEERFTRIKHDSNFPIKCINYILKSYNLTLDEIDKIVFYDKPFLKFERLLETYVAFAPKGLRSFLKSIPIWLREKLFLKNLIINLIKKIDKKFDKNKLLFCEHHISHAASAFYPSPFEEAIILVLDGVGEWVTTTVAIGNKNKIKICEEIYFPHSLGLLYSSFTYYLGFKVNSGEYKVMGLAPFGKPIYKDLILNKLIDLKEDGSFRLNQNYFSYATGLRMTNNKFNSLFNHKQRISEKDNLTQFHMDVAASIQYVTETILVKITNHLSNKYKLKNLCMAGGVALNCVANGLVKRSKKFSNIWVQPASGDAGGSLGAALMAWYSEYNSERILDNDKFDSMKSSLLGPKFTKEEVKIKLDKLKANYHCYEESKFIDIASRELNSGKAIGWFQGRMEFGPRSLGSRSILANPLIHDTQKNLNLKIKFRESFRPFAPAILYEELSNWFKIDYHTPYMLFVDYIQEDLRIYKSENIKSFGIDKLNQIRSKVPAITHIDYSARIQTVKENENKRFHKLIKSFYELTKCPILVNTSFNVRGEPIVCTPEDAFKCFMGTNLDILIIENFVLYKQEQDSKLLTDYKNKYTLD